MQAKKLTALFLTAAVTSSLFVCGQVQAADNSSSGMFPLEEPAEFDVVVMGGVDEVYDLTDTIAYKYLEEKTNVKFNVTTLTYTEYKEKINLMLNTGDYPDVFIHADKVPDVAKENEIVIPLEDLIAEYAPNYSALIENSEGGWGNVVYPDGHQYAMMSVDKSGSEAFGGFPFAYINTKWLENLGLDMPHDAESFYEVLKAFKENDCDGDGDSTNEIPLIFAGGDIIPVEDLLPYFGIEAEGFWSAWSKSEDGTSIEYFPITDRYKEMLRKLTTWYSEGLIYKDSMTLTHDQEEAMGHSGTSIGCYFAWEPGDKVGAYDASLPYEENLVTQYEAMTPWDGGKATSMSLLQGEGLWITDACENPEIIVAWADLLYTDEIAWLTNYGTEGDTYDIVDGMIKMRDKDNPSETYGESIKAALFGLDGGVVAPGKLYVDGYDEYYDRETNPYINYARDIGIEWEAEGLKYDPWPKLYQTAEENSTISDVTADTDPYWQQYRAEVITGAKDLDATWDEFISTMEAMGIQDAIDAKDAAYQRYLAQ